MRSLIRIVVVLAIIAAAGYGAVRGYTWYKVKQEVDVAIQQAAPFVDITYTSIFSSPTLDGTVGVDGIVIRPKMSADEFRIQSVRLSFGDILQLIKTNKKEMPKKMRFAIAGMSLDLNSPLLISLSQMQKQAMFEQKRKSGFDLMSFETLGCGSIEAIGLEELTRMGYSTMDMDIEMEYEYEKVKNLLTMDMVARIKGMQSVKMKAQLRVAPSDVLQGKEIKPVIDFMRFEVVDAGYAELRNRFCAAQLQANEEAYLGRHIELLSRGMGATFPTDTVEAYKQFMQGNGRMGIEIEPGTGVELETLGAYPLKDAIELLKLKVKLDKHEVDFAKFEWGKSSASHGSDADDASGADKANASPASAVPVPARYRHTAPSQLKRYVGYQARLKTDMGLQRDGVIESAEGSTITIRLLSPRGKGYISFPVDVSDIVSAEVLY